MADGPQRTRVQLEHRYLERYGDAAEAMHKTMNQGWAPMIEAYAGVAKG